MVMRILSRLLASATLAFMPVLASAYDAVDIALEALARGASYSEAAGAGPDSFDCSGLTHYAYAYVGVELPKASWEQALVGERVTLTPGDIGALRRGDLLFFANDADRLAARTVGHVGIYIGDGRFVHSELYRNGVRIDDISVEGFYRTHFLEARRLQAAPAPSSRFAANSRVVATETGVNIRGLGQGGLQVDWLGEVLASGWSGRTAVGAEGQVVDERPILLNGLWYWRVDFDSGDDGWIAESYLTTFAAISVSSASCTAPVVGQVMTCSVVGTNLPTTVSATATNCTPSPMAAAPGSTGNRRQFTCVPQQAGVRVQASYVVPGFIGPLPAVTFTPFSDQFAGTTFDTSKWSSVGSGLVTVSGDVANFACRSSLSTQGKYVVAGETIVIEARMAGTGPLRDTVLSLFEEDGSSFIQAGDTNYRGLGLYLLGAGSYALAQTGNGTSTSAYKEYRLTLSGRTARIERGDTLDAISESVTRDLASTVSGRAFYLLIGTGGPDYCPGSVDWITVTTR